MNEKTFNSFNDQATQMFAPMAKISQLMLNNIEKLTELQLENIKSYSKLGLHQLKSAGEVQDTESMRQFTVKQTEMMSQISKKIVDDTRQLTELGMTFKQDVERIIGESNQVWQNAEKTATTAAKSGAKATV